MLGQRRQTRSHSRELSDGEQSHASRPPRAKGASRRQPQLDLDPVQEHDSSPPDSRRRSYNNAKGIEILKDLESRATAAQPPAQPLAPASPQVDESEDSVSSEDSFSDSQELPPNIPDEQLGGNQPADPEREASSSSRGSAQAPPSATITKPVESVLRRFAAVQNEPAATPPSSAPPSSSAAFVLQRYAKATAENNKENAPLSRKRSLLDRQAGAERVAFDESEASGSSSSRPAKRVQTGSSLFFTQESDSGSPAEVEVQIGDDGDDFEVDDRPASNAAARREQLRGLTKRPQSSLPRERARSETVEAGPSAPIRSSQPGRDRDGLTPPAPTPFEQRTPPARQRTPPARRKLTLEEEDELRLPSPPPPPRPGDDINYNAVNQRAKQITSQRLAVAKYEPQVRRKWTETEVKALTRMIGKYGCRWSEISKKEPLLQGRDQVALKDKARNMKVDYLKTGIPLPDGFHDIPINAIQRRKLQELGINFEGR